MMSDHDLHLLGLLIKAGAIGVLISVLFLLVREAYMDSRRNCAACNQPPEDHHIAGGSSFAPGEDHPFEKKNWP